MKNSILMRIAAKGFTLVEMAMVMLIVALLLGGLVPTISSQMDQKNFNETRKLLNDIQQALIGYALINGHLPCPSTTDGVADAACTAPTSDDMLPWKTLGLPEADAWNGRWKYRVDPNFASSVPFTLTTATSSGLLIKDSGLNALTSNTEAPIAIVYSTGKNLLQDGLNATFDTDYQADTPNNNFDDVVVWISRPQLFNRMVAAGKLP